MADDDNKQFNDSSNPDNNGSNGSNASGDDPVNNDQQSANSGNDDKDINALIEQQVSEKLSPIKEKLDKAYRDRDDAIKRASRSEEEAKKAKLDNLESEGKELEALQLRYADLEGKYTSLQSENTELTRDRYVSEATTGLDFRNDSAKRMAMQEITGQLVQDSDGQWVHKSGMSIKEFVESYAKNDDKSFLFKPKQSSGAESMAAPGAGKADPKAPYMTKPISQLTTDEMMKATQAGRFGEVTDVQAMTAMFGG